MRKFFSVLLSLLLVVTLVPINGHANVEREAQFDDYGVRGGNEAIYRQLAATSEWDQEWTKKDVPLDYKWTINFSDIATEAKVEAITIEHKGKKIEVTATYNKSKVVTVAPAPKTRYLAGQDYTLKVLLKNGKKYKMDFTTSRKGVDVESNGKIPELFINDMIEGSVGAGDATDIYKISVPQNGELSLSLKSVGNLSMALFDKNGTDGDTLAYKKDESSITLKRELTSGLYYVRVEGTGSYTLNVTHTTKVVSAAQALENAQKAVYALPAPIDVQEKHREDINQAMALINVAKLFIANNVEIQAEIDKLEGIINKLQDVIAPIELTALVSGSKTVILTFSRPVQSRFAHIKINGIDPKKVTFNANQTIARVEMDKPLVAGKLEVNVDGIASNSVGLGTNNQVTIKPEEVAAIEIIGNIANRIAGDKVTVPYRVLNQYGEEMEADVIATATGAVVSGGSTATKGLVSIPIDPNNVKEGYTIKLELKSGTVTTTKDVTVSFKEAVAKIEIVGLYNEKKKILNERINLSDDPFYLIVKATDKFGNEIKDVNVLNQEGVIRIFNFAPTTVGINSVFEELPTGKIALKLTGTPKKGSTLVTLTALQTKHEASFDIKVDESTRTDSIQLIVSDEKATEGNDIYVTIDTKDKNNQPITEEEIITNAISGITWTIDQAVDYKVVKDTDGKLKLKIEGNKVKQGTLTITGQTSTGKTETLKVDVGEKVRPTKWEIKTNPVFTKDFDFGEQSEPKEQVIDATTVQIFDQYNKEMSEDAFKASSYRLVLTEAQPNGGAVKVEGNKVIAQAVGEEKVTIAIYNGNQPVENSAKDITFTVTDGSNYVRYEVAPIGTMYDAEGAPINKKTRSEKYNRKVTVLGVLANGEKEILDSSKYTIDAASGFTITDNILEINGSFYYDGKTETKRDITITIASSKEKIKKEVVISNVAPIVKSIELNSSQMSFNPTGNETFTLDKLTNLNSIIATDQYDVKSEDLSKNNHKFKFPDGTEIEPSVSFATVRGAGAHLFVDNDKPTAKVTDFSPNSAFTAVIKAGSVAAQPIQVNVTNGSMPSLEAKIAEITAAKIGELDNSKDVKKIAQSLVGSDYTLTIKSSDNPAIALDGTVTQTDQDVPTNVTFTITHKNQPSFTKDTTVITLTVKAADKVILTSGSLGTAGDKQVIGLTPNKKYITINGTDYYGVQADGTLGGKQTTKMAAEADAEVLTSGVITGLTNGTVYKVEEVSPTEVIVNGSIGKAGDQEITDLIAGARYIVQENTSYYGVKADGTLSAPQTTRDAAEKLTIPLIGTKIKGLKNGSMYTVTEASAMALTGVTAIAGNTEATVRFTAPTGATTVKVEMQENEGNWKDASTNALTATSTSATVTGLTNGASYKFRVVVTGGTYAGTSNETAAVIPVAKLANVKVENVGDKTVKLSFDAPTGATEVIVEQSTNGTSWSKATTELLNASSTNATVTGLTNGTTYHFRVRVTGGAFAGVSDAALNIVPVAVISIQSIPGNLVPVAGKMPTTTITSTAQYDATISWSPNTTPFEAGQVYTATIMLTPKKGFTLQGVGANFFSVQGATTTNAANSGIITAEFPAVPTP